GRISRFGSADKLGRGDSGAGVDELADFGAGGFGLGRLLLGFGGLGLFLRRRLGRRRRRLRRRLGGRGPGGRLLGGRGGGRWSWSRGRRLARGLGGGHLLLQLLHLLVLLLLELGLVGGDLLVHHRLDVDRLARRGRRILRGGEGRRDLRRGGARGRHRSSGAGRSSGSRGSSGSGSGRRRRLAAVEEEEGQDRDHDQGRDGGVEQRAALAPALFLGQRDLAERGHRR